VGRVGLGFLGQRGVSLGLGVLTRSPTTSGKLIGSLISPLMMVSRSELQVRPITYTRVEGGGSGDNSP
jgi:hypothetical protein